MHGATLSDIYRAFAWADGSLMNPNKASLAKKQQQA